MIAAVGRSFLPPEARTRIDSTPLGCCLACSVGSHMEAVRKPRRRLIFVHGHVTEQVIDGDMGKACKPRPCVVRLQGPFRGMPPDFQQSGSVAEERDKHS